MNLKKSLLSKEVGKAEKIVLAAYGILLCIIEYFHEPWFDEAQAWQIARCASLKEILFTIPHYEGHPPLWHLLLMLPAKLNFPYELSLFVPNFIFCMWAMWLLLFRSPFPKFVRCYIPFTFFPFYMYGILSRPYSMMMVAIMLSAISYRERNKKPVQYILCLTFLCFTSAFGVILAGGFCIVWVIEIIQEYYHNQNWIDILKEKRPYCLLGILIAALFILFSSLPAEDCYYAGNLLTLPQKLYRLRFILMLPIDATFGAAISVDDAMDIEFSQLLECIGGTVILTGVVMIAKKNHKLLMFLIPYLIYTLFASLVQFSVHHIGICLLLFIFFFWILLQDKCTIPEIFKQIAQKINSDLIKNFIKIAACIMLIMPVAYTIVSSYNDIRYAFGTKGFVDFIQENHLENCSFMSEWPFTTADTDEDLDVTNIVFDETLPLKKKLEIVKNRPNVQGLPASVLPYFDNNIFINFNADSPDKLYMTWKDLTEQETKELFALWREKGLPDFIFGLVPLEEVYPEEMLEGVTYYWIETIESGNIWKFDRLKGHMNIYIRNDLLDQYPQFEIQKYATILTEPITD